MRKVDERKDLDQSLLLFCFAHTLYFIVDALLDLADAGWLWLVAVCVHDNLGEFLVLNCLLLPGQSLTHFSQDTQACV